MDYENFKEQFVEDVKEKLYEQGRIYVYMTISSVERAIGRCHQKSCKLLDELERIGLIERVKQGQGRL